MKKLKLNLESEVQLVDAFVVTSLFNTYFCCFYSRNLLRKMMLAP